MGRVLVAVSSAQPASPADFTGKVVGVSDGDTITVQGWELVMNKPSGGHTKVMKVSMWLRVEGNNKYVRGKKKAREEIEAFVLSQYGMQKLQADGWEYVLSIPYETDEELDETIYQDILGEAENIAERRLCFIEADVASLDDPDRSW